jgi:WD40 repeat protein
MKKLAGHEGAVTAIAYDHRGALIASLGRDETLRLWVPATERQMVRRLDGEDFERLQFAANDRMLIATDYRQTRSRVWEVLGDEYVLLQARTGSADELRTIDFSPDGRLLAAVSGQFATLWDSTSGRELGVIDFTNAHAAWFSADSRDLIASTGHGLYRCPLIHQEIGMRPRLKPGVFEPLGQTSDELGSMGLSLDRRKAAVVEGDKVLLVPLEAGRNSDVRAIPVGIHYHHLVLHPDGSWLAAMVGDSHSIQLWNLSENADTNSPATVPGSEYFVFSPDGQWLVTCWEGEFCFYRVGVWKQPAFSIPRKGTQHAPVAFSRDGLTAAIGSSRYTIQLIILPRDSSNRPQTIATLESPDRSPLELLAFSPDGRALAAATADQTIQLWNLARLRNGLAKQDLARGWPEYP